MAGFYRSGDDNRQTRISLRPSMTTESPPTGPISTRRLQGHPRQDEGDGVDPVRVPRRSALLPLLGRAGVYLIRNPALLSDAVSESQSHAVNPT